MNVDLPALIEPVRAIALEAGRRIVEIYHSNNFSVTQKDDHSPLTRADLIAHTITVRGLMALTPAIPVISEEAPAVALNERRHWEWLWLVDPLDGTREFIRRSGQFSVNIALIHEHAPVLGLILIPVSGVCYFAYRHGGAFKLLPNGQSRAIHTRHRNGHQLVRVVASIRAHHCRTLQGYLNRLGRYDYLDVGGALKSCLVAEGQADIYPRFGPTGEWDTAAAQIIVEEAGGGLTDLRQQPLRYNARATLTNPDFLVFGDASHDWSQYLPGHYS